MLIDEPSVVVPRHLAQPLLELAVDAAREAKERGELHEGVRLLLLDLARAAQSEDVLVPSGTGMGSGRFRGLILDGMSTSEAALRLNISDRAVRKRLLEGKLRGEKRHGAWVVDRGDVDR